MASWTAPWRCSEDVRGAESPSVGLGEAGRTSRTQRPGEEPAEAWAAPCGGVPGGMGWGCQGPGCCGLPPACRPLSASFPCLLPRPGGSLSELCWLGAPPPLWGCPLWSLFLWHHPGRSIKDVWCSLSRHCWALTPEGHWAAVEEPQQGRGPLSGQFRCRRL